MYGYDGVTDVHGFSRTSGAGVGFDAQHGGRSGKKVTKPEAGDRDRAVRGAPFGRQGAEAPAFALAVAPLE